MRDQILFILPSGPSARLAGFKPDGDHHVAATWRAWWPSLPLDRLHGCRPDAVIVDSGTWEHLSPKQIEVVNDRLTTSQCFGAIIIRA